MLTGLAARAWRIRAVWCQLCRIAWSSMKNWQVSGVSKYSEIGAARSSSLVAQGADGLGGELAVPAEEGDRLLAGRLGVLAGMVGVDVVHRLPGDAGDRLARGDGLGELDLERIHGGDVMDDDADRPPVAGHADPPLGVGEGGGQVGQVGGPLFEAVGEGVGAAGHGGLLKGLGAIGRVVTWSHSAPPFSAELRPQTRHAGPTCGPLTPG